MPIDNFIAFYVESLAKKEKSLLSVAGLMYSYEMIISFRISRLNWREKLALLCGNIALPLPLKDKELAFAAVSPQLMISLGSPLTPG
jgi:hypothetical protein